MICKRSFRFFVISAALVITSALCCGACCIDAAASSPIVKQSASDFRSIIGNSLPVSYTLNGVRYTSTLQYSGVITGFRGINVAPNDILSSQSTVTSYDCIMYEADTVATSSFPILNDIEVDLYLSFDEYARGGFGMTSPVGTSSVVSANNSVSSYPDNYSGSFRALTANTQVDSSLSGYYGVINTNDVSGNSWNWRPIVYEINGGGVIDGVHFDSIVGTYARKILFCIWCPYIGGNVATAPAETTSTSSGGGQTIINNNVDLTETHSILGGITNFLEDIWEAIRGVPSSILQGIQGIFVPSEGFMDEQLEELQESFAWYDDIKTIGTNFTEAFNLQAEASAPVISIPSIGSHGHVYTSEAEIVLDLSEYQEAVLSVRTILAILLWIFFLWRLYGRLPDIIHGGGMIIGDGSRIMDEMDNRATQSVFNDIDYHANSIFQGTMPDIPYIDNPDHVDWRV